MSLVKLCGSDGSWQKVKAEWEEACKKYDEDFSNFGIASLPVLDALAETPEKAARICGFQDNTGHAAVCQANVTPLPGYVGPVLRVRMITLSPNYDFGEYPIDAYAQVLGGLFAGILALSQGDMKADHIKFHVRSPADFQFFRTFQAVLAEQKAFSSVKMQGAWLYVTK